MLGEYRMNKQTTNIDNVISQLCQISEALIGIEIIANLYSTVSKNPSLAQLIMGRVTNHLFNQAQYINHSMVDCVNNLVEIQESLKTE